MNAKQRRAIEMLNRRARRNNRAKVCGMRVCPQPTQLSRATKRILKQGKDEAWLTVLSDRDAIPFNSKNQRLPRLCPRI